MEPKNINHATSELPTQASTPQFKEGLLSRQQYTPHYVQGEIPWRQPKPPLNGGSATIQPFTNVPTYFKLNFLVNLLYLLSSCCSYAVSIRVRGELSSTKTCAEIRPNTLSSKVACEYSRQYLLLSFSVLYAQARELSLCLKLLLMQSMVSIRV